MTNPQVTERYAEEEPPKSAQVTQIYAPPSVQITQRYVDDAAEKSANKASQRSGLAVGTLIADRYGVESSPLGIASGEADVYKCFDNLKQCVVAVKLYHAQTTPKESVIQILKQLKHPNIVSISEYGEWQGRFYEVMEYCSGGVMSDYMPLSEADIRAALPGLIHALEHCHRQGIIHRDIKPNNLFFNHPVERQPLIGDFGISSYLAHDNSIRKTQTAGNLTLDYAAPELLDGHEVGAKTDYYSLGITLLHLLLGHSPFQGLMQNDILVTHLRGRVPLPDNLSLEFHQLLRGLILPNPTDRWGYQQVLAWLRGENVPLRLDSLQQADPDKSSKPYPGYLKARTKEELAQNLDQFDAFKQLQRGDIRRWVFDNINQNLAEEIAYLESEDYAERAELALYKLKGLLDNNTPLPIGQHRVVNLHELLALLSQAETEPQLAEDLSAALWEEYLESWLINHKPAGQRNAELIAKIADLRQRLEYKAPEIALFALSIIIDPQTPVKINQHLALSAPQDLAALFKKSPIEVEIFLTEFFYSLRFEEWLRAAMFSGWEKDLQFLKNTRQFYLDKKKQGTFCVLWHCYPQLPFQFAGQYFTEPPLLARAIDASRENTEQGMQLLENGWLRAWLVGSGKITPIELDAALLDTNTTTPSKLEAVLHLLAPDLPNPKLQSSLSELDFKIVCYGESKTKIWNLTNMERGYLNGEILLAHYGSGLSLDNYLVEGNEKNYQITLKVVPSLSEGLHTNTLIVHSNGGDIEVPVRFIVRARPKEKQPWWQVLLDVLFDAK